MPTPLAYLEENPQILHQHASVGSTEGSSQNDATASAKPTEALEHQLCLPW